MIQKLNAEGRLEKKETKKGSYFDKVRTCVEFLVLLNIIELCKALRKTRKLNPFYFIFMFHF